MPNKAHLKKTKRAAAFLPPQKRSQSGRAYSVRENGEALFQNGHDLAAYWKLIGELCNNGTASAGP
jgi:hypothetical protein